MTNWTIRSRGFEVTISAPDQHAAWNTLRNRPESDFGLVVSAFPDGGEDNLIAVHTSALMTAWRRNGGARRFRRHAIAMGLPDTAASDRRYATDHGLA